jgi:tetratricopeptide (TPR) repeat protein
MAAGGGGRSRLSHYQGLHVSALIPGTDPVQIGVARASVAAPRSRLGERIRQLRVARGLTQSELAGDRFSKQYMSGIERGATRPSEETLGWLADRLGVDRRFLELGLPPDDWARTESMIARAEAAAEAHECESALSLLAEVSSRLSSGDAVELELRARLAEGWARLYVGEPLNALKLFERAYEISTGAEFGELDRADALFRLGCARYKLSSVTTALALFTNALTLAESSGVPCDRLRSLILGWRSRCYRRQRDWPAAQEDAERALELAESLNDSRALADAEFQGSIIAERQGRWVLARSYAERAKMHYEAIGDRLNVGRLLNNLGGLTFLLGNPDEARAYLKKAFVAALDVGSQADAAQAVSSLAQVNLRTGNSELAEDQARQALELLKGRNDFLDEVGNSELVLGRALLNQDRLDEAEEHFAAAEDAFTQLSSASHRAAAWTARGDLAVRRGDKDSAVLLYQRAIDALQDFRF